MAANAPRIRITEIDGRIRLGLDGFSDVEGTSLQDAADQLVERLIQTAMAVRNGEIGPFCSECYPDLSVLDFLWQLGDLAARGGDPRDLLFGPNPLAA